MSRHLALVVLALLTSACEHAQSRPVMAPDGAQGWFIECRHDKGACLDEAAERCPHGYDVEDSEQHAGPAYVQSNGFGGATVHHTFRGSMTVRCH